MTPHRRNRSIAWPLFVAILVSTCVPAHLPGADDHPPALSPDKAVKSFTVAEGLGVNLVVAEPQVSQPLSITFDDRCRMWVLQYLQYPNPNGLTPVEMDNWLRTKYDRVPEPPPKGPHGRDRISIYEDTDGDGRSDVVKHFITDLNLASGMALGYDGVFVAQPPYLLFYADADHDDVPDGPPEVLLKGFGMEDAHAFANSLTWGPDGWLYGAQGSTATAEIDEIGFQQGVWRYHPLTQEFELFAEGGGNTWGIDFDRHGNLFAAGNTVEPLVHHVQGAYYVKGFGKHGPLHNPHAYGYFQPVEHHGYVGDSLTGGAIIYQGGAFPEQFNDACIAPNTRHSAMRWSTIELKGSSFATRAAGDFITSTDIWFRPVDSTVGPDGALYVADWYDYNISHSSPQNRSQWYQPSRFDGRVWRIAPPHVRPVAAGEYDLGTWTSAELVELLHDPNDWYARQARRILAERRDTSILPLVEDLATHSTDQRLALQGLWARHVTAGLDEAFALRLLDSPHEYVRAWTIRLLGDECVLPQELEQRIQRLARDDVSVIVRSQLACTAKRLPADDALSIVAGLLQHDADTADPHIPLLIWWAIEANATSASSDVHSLIASDANWHRPLVREFIIERLARRYAAEATNAGFLACATLLEFARRSGNVDFVLSGIKQAFAGRRFSGAFTLLEVRLNQLLQSTPGDARPLELLLRLGVPDAVAQAITFIHDASASDTDKVAIIGALGETKSTSAVDPLLSLLDAQTPEAVRSAAIAALGALDDQRIPTSLLAALPAFSPETQRQAIEVLCARQASSLALLEAVDRGELSPALVAVDALRPISDQADERTQALLVKHWGRIQPATPLEKQGRITALGQMLARAAGEAGPGRAVFEKTCANCHKLHGAGNEVGPDLTGAERKDRLKLLENIVDPSAVVRQQYIAHVAVTTDGRVLTGLLAESTPETITLLDAKNQRTVLARGDVEELRESQVSLMPEKLLDELSDRQIRDLFAYLQSDGPVAANSR